MAAIDPACNRIRYLIGDRDQRQATPSTITGYQSNDATHIYSYAMLIAIYNKDANTLWVTNERSSVTTNRHIKACRLVANSL